MSGYKGMTKQEYQRQWRAKNPGYNAAWLAARPGYKAARYAKNLAFVNRYKMFCGCTDCDYREDPYGLEFDHIEKKSNAIGKLTIGGRRALKKEMRKCQVVCRACHIKRTKARGQDVPM